MPDGEHCILVRLASSVDQASGFSAKTLEAYKDALHSYVWEAMAPLGQVGGFRVVPDRWVFEVDDPAGGSHSTDVILGGLDPGLFDRLFERWRALPLEHALDAASRVPAGEPGFSEADIRRAWEDESDVDRAFSDESMAARQEGLEVEDDLNTPGWAEDAHVARQAARGFYDFGARFFSLPHGSSKLSESEAADVRGAPEDFALVFVPVEAGARRSPIGGRPLRTPA